MHKFPPATTGTVHLPQLDTLRAMAALAVLGYHAIVLTYGWDYMDPNQTFLSTFRESHSSVYRLVSPLALGWMGVQLFFVLSGFCIHLTFARTRVAPSLRDFFSRRFWRIYPAYLVAIFAIELGKCQFNPTSWWVEKKAILIHVLMIHDLNYSWFWGISGSFWTLAYEWQYYCIYPLFLFSRNRLGLITTLSFVTALGVGSHFLLVATPKLTPLYPEFYGLQLYILWCIGAWLAERFVANKSAIIHPLFAGLLMLPLVACGSWYRPLCAGVFAASILDWMIRRRLHSIGRLLIPVGLISYSFYLFHQPLLLAIGPHLIVRNHPAASLLTVCASTLSATLICAWMGYKFVEVPGIRFGSFLRKRSLKAGSFGAGIAVDKVASGE